MRYVILRDDDTNALTPIECLERLYRPFLERNLPVNLAVIPDVDTTATMPNGKREGFLPAAQPEGNGSTVPIGANRRLVEYLLANRAYHIVQHGCHHTYLEFDSTERSKVARCLDEGTRQLAEAGFARPQTFVAPYDKLSRESLIEVSARFEVLSTGWFELRRLPMSWWPRYALKKVCQNSHWRIGRTLLLTHPGCLLSYTRAYSTMLEQIRQQIQHQQLTVLVTHWWEYFRDGHPDQPFIESLHETAEYLAGDPEIEVISFDALVERRIALN